MPTADRKPRRRNAQAIEPEWQTEDEALAACDAARELPEPQRSEHQRELRPKLRRFILTTWAVVPHQDVDEWLARVIELHYIRLSPFR